MAPRTSAETADAISLGGIKFNRVVRAALKDSTASRADIKTLMSKEHRVVDLHRARQGETEAGERPSHNPETQTVSTTAKGCFC